MSPMLFQKIYYVSFAIYELTFGTTYYAHTNDVQGCDAAGANDRCVFVCGQQDWGSDFECGNAGICDITCVQNQCMMSSTITATNSQQLNVLSHDALKCYHQTIFRLPNTGSANFSATAHSVGSFTEMIINAGTNTQSIAIDCAHAGICDRMTVNAQTSEFLFIDLKGSALRGPVNIYCPVNVASSNYKPYEAPCYIDAWNQATLSDVTIHSLLGMPHDIYINADDTTNWNYISLTCPGIDSKASVDETEIFYSKRNVNQCWNTRNPTKSPTNHPAPQPTLTLSITSRPSASPTIIRTQKSQMTRSDASAQFNSMYILWISIITGVLAFCIIFAWCGGCGFIRKHCTKQHKHRRPPIDMTNGEETEDDRSAMVSNDSCNRGFKGSEIWSTQTINAATINESQLQLHTGKTMQLFEKRNEPLYEVVKLEPNLRKATSSESRMEGMYLKPSANKAATLNDVAFISSVIANSEH